jgi:hypothetical protein
MDIPERLPQVFFVVALIVPGIAFIGGFYGQISARNFAFVQTHLALLSVLVLLLSVLLPVAAAFAVYSFVPAVRSGVNPLKWRTST